MKGPREMTGAALALALLGASACSTGGARPSPVSLDAGAPPPDFHEATGGPAPDAGPFRRSVTVRSPFGTPAENLLLDGDFEFSTVAGPSFYTQVGWSAYSIKDGTTLNLATETGGLCRTGLRCMVATADMALYGQGAAANGVGNAAAVWARLPDGLPCTDLSATLLDCGTGNVDETLRSDGPAGDDGWCGYHVRVGRHDSAICLYVESKLKGKQTALVDSALLAPDDGTSGVRSAEFFVPPADLVGRIQTVVEAFRRSRRIDPPRRVRPADPDRRR